MVEKNNFEGELMLNDLREKFDVVGLSKSVRKKGDILVLSQELKIKPRRLNSLISEGRIINLIPNISKSKAGILSALRTDREVFLFSEKYDLENIKAKDLMKLVGEWNASLCKDPSLLISQEEHDLIVGSLMGDAYVRKRNKNSCFRVAHSIKQKDFMDWKFALLKKFNFSEFLEKKRFIKGREVDMIYLSTKTHPVFNYYRNLFYRNGTKTITKKILEHLNPRSLAVWVCDDGSHSRTQNYIILCTNSFSLEEHKLIKEFFNKKFGLDPTIGFRDGKYYYLRFKKGDTEKLVSIIKPFVPKSMLYKIGENKHGRKEIRR